MSENKAAEQSAEIRKIDITDIIDRFLHSLKRRWWAVVILTILIGGYRYFQVSRYQNEVYEASETLSVSATSAGQDLGSDNYNNVITSSQLGKIANILISNGMLDAAIEDDLGLDYMPASISASSIDNTNLLTISATGSDAQLTYDTLQAAIRQLPNVAQSIVGQIDTETLIPAEVPANSGREVVIRGSARKGAMMGFALGMLIVLIDMLMWRTITHTSDIHTLLHIQSMGKLPIVKGKKRRKNKKKEINIMDKRTSEDYQESIRAIRARVERRMEKLGEKTFLVTSSIPSEGKSTVSANLALAFAKKGKRTILIDCDLRHPSIQNVLGIEGDFPGLEKVLKGEASLESALYRYEDSSMDLYVIPGAREVSENIDILGGETMRDLIHQLEGVCDVLVLDTSPSAMLADALNLAKVAPMAVYVIRCEYAQVKHILHGVTELEDTGIKMIGCVLNYSKTGSKGRSASYGYGSYGTYGYGNYGKYGYGKKRGKKGQEDDDNFLADVSFAEHSIGAALEGEQTNIYEVQPAGQNTSGGAQETISSDSRNEANNVQNRLTEEAEAARLEAENARQQAEAAAAEQARMKAEAEAAAAEQARLREEAEAAAAEQIRMKEETEAALRAAEAEASRLAAEREQMEAALRAAEAEASRLAAEREQMDAARRQAEEARAAAEQQAEKAAEAAIAVRHTELQDVEKKLERVNRSIELLEIIQENRSVFKVYQTIRSEKEKIAFARQYKKEMVALTNASKELSSLYEGQRIPRLEDVKEEKDFLLVKQRELQD